MTTLRISQLADRVGIKPTTLRFYEQAGLLPAQRSSSGYRLYDEQAVERTEFIVAGRDLGLTLAEIRELLDVWAEGPCADVRAALRPALASHIAEAERRTAALDAFMVRLRHVLSEIDGPAPAGRCGPGCGLPRPAPEREATVIACTLNGDGQAERIGRWQLLLSGARRERVPGGLLMRLPVERAGPVAELAAAEQRCCAFFAFTLRIADDGMQLLVHAPEDAAPLVDAVFGVAALDG